MLLINKIIFPFALLLASNYAFSNQTYTIDELNDMTVDSYEKSLSAIFEDTTWPIVEAAKKRPFIGFVDMYINIVKIVENSGADKQLELIKSHPELACKTLRNNNIAILSQGEQSSAGLNECTEDEAKELAQLNASYSEKFGFPFLLAVKNASKEQIFTSVKMRMNNNPKTELDIALQQEYKIVLFRLLDQVK